MEAIANKKYMVGDRVIADGEKSVILELRRTCAQVEPSFDLVEYGDIQPIPLTAEILEKNEFEIEPGKSHDYGYTDEDIWIYGETLCAILPYSYFDRQIKCYLCYDGNICIPEFDEIFEYFGVEAEGIEPKTDE